MSSTWLTGRASARAGRAARARARDRRARVRPPLRCARARARRGPAAGRGRLAPGHPRPRRRGARDELGVRPGADRRGRAADGLARTLAVERRGPGRRPPPRSRSFAARRSRSSTPRSRTRSPARQRTEIVDVRRSALARCRRLTDVLGWEVYVVAALVVQGNTVGLLHADAGAGGPGAGRSTSSMPRSPPGTRGAGRRVRARRPARDAPAATITSSRRRSSG